LLRARAESILPQDYERGIPVPMANNHQTNQLPIVQNESVADAAPVEASTPHFDDIAVAIAQPVQPLAKHNHAIASSASVLRPLLFALVACVVIATLATAVSLFGLPRHDETSEPTAAAAAAEPAEAEISGGILQTNVSTQSEQRRRHRRSTFLRMTPNHVIVVAEDNEGKPGARKVGEIRYSHGTDRP
jgi:hypothetical protein